MKSFKEFTSPEIIKEAIEFHRDNHLPYTQCMFRYGSEKYFEYFREIRDLYKDGLLEILDEETDILNSDLGTFDLYEGELVPLDFVFVITEDDSGIELNKPKRGGSKKFYVHVRDPQTKNIKKISFGDTTGLSVKYNNPERKKSFAARHNCASKTDKTTPGYWACRVNKYLGTTDAARSGYW